MRNWMYIVIAILAMCCVIAALIVPSLFSDSPHAQPQPPTATIAADKDTILFDVEIEGKPCIARSAISTWHNRPLSVVTDGMHPRLSRTGDWMFFERSNGASHEIWRRKLSTNDGQELMLHETSQVAIYDVSSDGSALIIQIDRPSGGLANISEFRLFDANTREYSGTPLGMGGCFLSDGALVIAPDDGSGLRRRSASGEEIRLTKAGAFPIASQDGQRLLYLINPQVPFQNREWAVLDLNNSELRQIGHAANPVFSGDGDSVIFFDSKLNGVIWRYDINSGSSHELGKLSGYAAYWTTSPAGTAGAIPGTPSTILLLDPSGKSIKSFFPLVPPIELGSEK